MCILALLALGACSRSLPAPIFNKSATWAISKPKPRLIPARVIVQAGQTVYSIARHYNLEPRDLISANYLLPPYMVKPGRILTLPQPSTYFVKNGDTIFEIARDHNVDMSALIRTNKLKKPYTIYVGQRLSMPGRRQASTVQLAQNKAGGQQTFKLKKPTVDTMIPARNKPAKNKPAKPQIVDAAPPRRSGGRFVWPVKGRLLSRFGPKKGGLYNDGINISAKQGEPMLAAENGVVAYAGNELRGFGNLLLIRHSGGWMTAYAHADKLVVKRGQKVNKGQIIGHAGTSGSVSKPQVHFEIRKGNNAVNPLKYLTASNGQRRPVTLASN
ncbi:MAG: peptidoglycan DD-metalloendopeptidase family protein [Alphaproteobacteria bacterium]|nr:peptidoglycan DD-metalloendopeptidase family protein [Alphaproteobacteria bacterium]MBT6384379.1 peptidoglycan DD-metalloendopeptidase family protein [Alphaproteobacteria bacterium]